MTTREKLIAWAEELPKGAELFITQGDCSICVLGSDEHFYIGDVPEEEPEAADIQATSEDYGTCPCCKEKQKGEERYRCEACRQLVCMWCIGARRICDDCRSTEGRAAE